MFHRAILIALLATVPAVAMVPMDAVAADASRSDAANALQTSVELEIKGMEALMDMWNETTNDVGDWSPEALASHEAGVQRYEDAIRLNRSGDYKKAYIAIHDAWNLHKPATTEAVQRAPGARVDSVLSLFIDAIDARIEAFGDVLDGAPAAAKANYNEAKAAYNTAEAAHEAGKRKRTTNAINTALSELHDTFEILSRSAQSKKRRG